MRRGFEINKGRFDRELKKKGLLHPRGSRLAGKPNATAFARQIGMDTATAWRVLNGEAMAGTEFVENVLDAWDMEFHDLFKVTTKTRRRVAA
jgi:hypothetical protein